MVIVFHKTFFLNLKAITHPQGSVTERRLEKELSNRSSKKMSRIPSVGLPCGFFKEYDHKYRTYWFFDVKTKCRKIINFDRYKLLVEK